MLFYSALQASKVTWNDFAKQVIPHVKFLAYRLIFEMSAKGTCFGNIKSSLFYLICVFQNSAFIYSEIL